MSSSEHGGVPGLDTAALERHLAAVRPGLADGPLRAELLPGGRSNLTYRLTDGRAVWALRRPPLGHVLPTAHDMAREFRVLSALAGSAVPVPRTVLLTTDISVLGAPFYLMEFVPGRILRTPAETPGRDRLRRIGERLVDVLAELHLLDPAAVGLGSFGRPEGFLERQLGRWSEQLARSRSRELPGADELAARLAAALPRPQRAVLLHGDFRLANAVLAADDAVAAVLDWEMSTLGDPLVDLAVLRLYSDGAAGIPEPRLPDPGALLERYAAATGLDPAPLPWYAAFARFKLAVILEGIHLRHSRGQTLGTGFEGVGDRVVPLLRDGLAELEGRR